MNTTHLIKDLNTIYNCIVIPKFIKSFVQIVINSLFPISNADKLLFSYTPKQVLRELPKAPKTPIKDTYSIFAYKNELVTRLVWNIKYKKNVKAMEVGGYALYRKIGEIINKQTPITNDPSYAKASDYAKDLSDKTEGKQFLLIPIPITQKRRNERGFNQCELIVDEILRLDKTDGKIITSKDLLIRTVHKDRQTLKSREERLEDAKNIFSINKKILDSLEDNYYKSNQNLPENNCASDTKSIKDLTAIVIDDVITTGSTMKEAMETLRSAGFGRVIGISLAH
jgi:predicted amidophosphoribosyltransferase